MIDDIDILLETVPEATIDKPVIQSPRLNPPMLATIQQNSMTNLHMARSPNLLNRPAPVRQGGNQDIHQLNLAKFTGAAPKVTPLPMDYSLFFFFKYSLNYIFDYYLTMTVFQSLKLGKYHTRLTKFNLISFLNYMVNYLYIPTKKFCPSTSIEVYCKVRDDIVANYEYIRLLVFNFLSFIITNTANNQSQSSQKEIKIYVEYDNLSESEGTFKFCFEFSEPNAIIPYQKLKDLLEANKQLEVTPETIERFYKYMDVGLFVSFCVIKNIYGKELKIDIRGDVIKIIFEVSGKHSENKCIYEVIFKIN
jgi:hypothetical protein